MIKVKKLNMKITSLTCILSVIMLFLGFAVLEPMTTKAVTDTFIVTQTVTSEISFTASTSDVAMSGSINGISGGTATGQTQVGILTNDSAGYSLTIEATSSPAMQGQTQGDQIDDYTPVGAVPDFSWNQPPASGAEFGYTVSASTTADLDLTFKDNGTDTCGTGSNDTSGSASCWFDLDTAAETIINRSSETGSSGENSTIYFQTEIMNNAFIIEDTYEATVILTATTN